MPFICPDCENNRLEIVHSIELGPDGSNDEFSLQSLRCHHCGLTCVAEYCESRRGASDSWKHIAHRISPDEFQLLNNNLGNCTTPRDHRCSCPAHQYYRVVEHYRLRPLSRINHDNQFFHLKLSP